MFLKTILAAILILSTSSVSKADPNWFVRHKKMLTLVAVNSAAIGVHAAGLAHCRKGDVENCDAHYGAAWATFGASAALTGVVFPILADQCWKGGDNKLCYFVGYTPAAYQLAWGFNEWHQFSPEKDAKSLAIKRDWLYDLRKK